MDGWSCRKRQPMRLGKRLAALLAVLYLLPALVLAEDGSLERGRYLFALAGCKGCHTVEGGSLLAGGRALDTPFGRFYTPNITPDPVTGIGRWSLEQFKQALRRGESPAGEHYYPVFPYTSYTGMLDQDVADLWTYLQSVPAVVQANKEHDLPWPFRWRFLMLFWKWLFFDEGAMPSLQNVDSVVQRGGYIVNALGHCGECHTPRNLFGVLDRSRWLAGSSEGPEGSVVPNITPDSETGIGSWSAGDIDALLAMGMLPDADFVGAGMGEVVDNTTAQLTDSDRAAVIRYLQSIQPLFNPLLRNKRGAESSY